MSIVCKINYQEIPDSDILNDPEIIEPVTIEDNLVASSLKLELDNTRPEKYDDSYPSSIFYGTNFYKQPVIIYDSDLDKNIFQGRIDGLEADSKKVTITANNNVYNLVKTICEYVNSSNKTPAQIMREIMINAGISDSEINAGYYNLSREIQQDNSAYLNVNYTIDANVKCIDVLKEISRITQCDLWCIDNIMFIRQWQPWDGDLGQIVYEKNIIMNSFKHYTDDSTIYNYFSIAYLSGSEADYASGSDSESIEEYGKSPLLVPGDDLGTDPDEYKILFRNSTGASWAGNLAINRRKKLTKKCSLTIGEELNDLSIGDQIDLYFTPYIREPVLIIGKDQSKENEFTVNCEFLNMPIERVERDTTPPDPVEINASMIVVDKNLFIHLRWTQSPESDHKGYKIYFTSSEGQWEGEYSDNGISPITVTDPDIDGEDYCYLAIGGLNKYTKYYLKVISYDINLNESEDSNIVDIIFYSVIRSWIEEQRILPSVQEDGAYFGRSVSISGDVAIMGAYYEDAGGSNRGAAYIFRYNEGTWTEEQRILPSVQEDDARFGYSVSISGDVAIVGAHYEDAGGTNMGAVYIFRYNEGTWTEEQRILPSVQEDGAYFGRSVSISGDVAIVGAHYEDAGDANRGAAYIFRYNEGIWTEEQRILPSVQEYNAQFGNSVSINVDKAIVGAWSEDDGSYNRGAAYIFKYDEGTWTEEQRILPSVREDGACFGSSVSIEGNIAIVGAYGEDAGGTSQGAAYIFEYNDDTWTEKKRILPSVQEDSASFGLAVSINGDVAIIGAYTEDGDGTNRGAVYIFRNNEITWIEEQRILSSIREDNAFFGFSVSINGDVAIAGSYGEDADGTNRGAVYIFGLIEE